VRCSSVALFAASTLAIACEPPPEGPPVFGELVQVVPSDGLPDEVVVQDSANNLDVVEHEGRVYLAFRTAPNHFASTETVMWIVSSTDEVNWDFESRIAMGTDLREPRFLSWQGHLFLYFAVLGENVTDFEPQGMMLTEHLGPADWTEPESFYEPGFIAWRTKVVDGVPYMLAYVGGENLYDFSEDPVLIHFLTTDDGRRWVPVVPDHPVVHEGGGSETDFVLLDDGSLVAVMRNELGDADGWGSKVCRAPADDLATWTCRPDPRKFDSPILFRQRSGVWLIARRQLFNDGNYDLGLRNLPREDQVAEYEGRYSSSPKRCSLWKVDPVTSTVDFVLDLPSKGDTCFPGILPHDTDVTVYNYTSPVDGPDIDWLIGQIGVTTIYRLVVHFP